MFEEHGELAAYRKKPLCKSMVFSLSRMTTDGWYHTMEDSGLSNVNELDQEARLKKANSTESVGSTSSHSQPGKSVSMCQC